MTVIVDFTWGCVILVGWWNPVPSPPPRWGASYQLRAVLFSSLSC